MKNNRRNSRMNAPILPVKITTDLAKLLCTSFFIPIIPKTRLKSQEKNTTQPAIAPEANNKKLNPKSNSNEAIRPKDILKPGLGF